MIIDKEEKFQSIFNKIKEKPTVQNMFKAFLAAYPENWKELKINFSKFNRSKQFGRTIPLPKPEQALQKEIRIWLKNNNNK